jgi:cytochrome P450
MYIGWSLFGLSMGPTFFEQRKIARKAVGPTAAPQYDALIQEQIAAFLRKLPTTSGDPFDVLTPLVHHFDTLNFYPILSQLCGRNHRENSLRQ